MARTLRATLNHPRRDSGIPHESASRAFGITQPKAFVDAARQELFSGNLTAGEVAGINAILAAWDGVKPKPDGRFVAYSLATASWETGQKMLPVQEIGEGRGQRVCAAARGGGTRLRTCRSRIGSARSERHE
jgi:hypothetical protein